MRRHSRELHPSNNKHKRIKSNRGEQKEKGGKGGKDRERANGFSRRSWRLGGEVFDSFGHLRSRMGNGGIENHNIYLWLVGEVVRKKENKRRGKTVNGVLDGREEK